MVYSILNILCQSIQPKDFFLLRLKLSIELRSPVIEILALFFIGINPLSHLFLCLLELEDLAIQFLLTEVPLIFFILVALYFCSCSSRYVIIIIAIIRYRGATGLE